MHLDWAVHYVKVTLDEVFGRDRFLVKSPELPRRRAIGQMVCGDTILLYARQPARTFNLSAAAHCTSTADRRPRPPYKSTCK